VGGEGRERGSGRGTGRVGRGGSGARMRRRASAGRVGTRFRLRRGGRKGMRGRLLRVGLTAGGACGLLRREERRLAVVHFAARIGRGVRWGKGSRTSRSRLGSSRLGSGRPGLGMRGARIRGGGCIDMCRLVSDVGSEIEAKKDVGGGPLLGFVWSLWSARSLGNSPLWRGCTLRMESERP